MMMSITKLSVLLSIVRIMQPTEIQPGVDYSYLGDFCTPKKFSTLPCLEEFCAAIDQEMHIWATNNASVESKIKDL